MPSLMRRINERRVFEKLQRDGPMSRADLSRRTQISPRTISTVVASFLARGLVEEQEPIKTSVGRPAKVVQLCKTHARILAITLGPKMCELALCGLDGSLEDGLRLTFLTPSSYNSLLDSLERHANKLIGTRSVSVLGLGLCAPAMVDTNQQYFVRSSQIPMLRSQSPGRELAKRLNIEVSVLLKRDNALCLAESYYGLAKRNQNFVVIDLYDGLGVSAVIRGQLFAGATGLATEIGHTMIERDGKPCACGSIGCFETVATDKALVELLSENIGREFTIDAVIDGVRDGSIAAIEEINQVVEYLSVFAAGVINTFNPDSLFVFGRLFDVALGLFERFQERVQRRSIREIFSQCQIQRGRATSLQGVIAGVLSRLIGERLIDV